MNRIRNGNSSMLWGRSLMTSARFVLRTRGLSKSLSITSEPTQRKKRRGQFVDISLQFFMVQVDENLCQGKCADYRDVNLLCGPMLPSVATEQPNLPKQPLQQGKCAMVWTLAAQP